MKQSTISLLLGISMAMAGERMVSGHVYFRGNWVENAAVTVIADTTVTDYTGNNGSYLIRLDPVGISGLNPTVQEMTRISINGTTLSFDKNSLSEVAVNDFRGRLLFRKTVQMEESSLELPSLAREPLLLTLTSPTGNRKSIRWIAGGSVESAAAAAAPQIRGAARAAEGSSGSDALMRVEYAGYPAQEFPITLELEGTPNRVELIDSAAGSADSINMELVHWVTSDTDGRLKAERVPFLEFAGEMFTHIDMYPETEYVLSGKNCYTEIRKEGNNGFIAIDLDSAESPETALYGTVMSEEVISKDYPYSEIETHLCYTYINTPVQLLNAADDVIVQETLLDSMGRYCFPDIPDGEYRIAIPDYEGLEEEWIQSVNTEVSRKNDLYGAFYHMAVAPNIYLYPEESCEVSVQVDVMNGGTIPYSIPKYNDGWSVTADPDGTINDSLGFLYYDFYCNVPYQSDSGWVISMENFDHEITDLLQSRGLNSQEIYDFIDFWKKYLVKYDWAVFCPIDAAEMVTLTVNPEPMTLFRELYLVLPSKGEKPVFKEPARGVPFERKGFTVVEWGGHLQELKLGDVIKE